LIIPKYKSLAFCNQKVILSQNILGVVTFFISIAFVYARWEGSAQGQVLRNTFTKGFSVLEANNHVDDAEYALIFNYLYPVEV
jgi:hypothetical protein